MKHKDQWLDNLEKLAEADQKKESTNRTIAIFAGLSALSSLMSILILIYGAISLFISFINLFIKQDITDYDFGAFLLTVIFYFVSVALAQFFDKKRAISEYGQVEGNAIHEKSWENGRKDWK